MRFLLNEIHVPHENGCWALNRQVEILHDFGGPFWSISSAHVTCTPLELLDFISRCIPTANSVMELTTCSTSLHGTSVQLYPKFVKI